MRLSLAFLTIVLLILLATPSMAQERGERMGPPQAPPPPPPGEPGEPGRGRPPRLFGPPPGHLFGRPPGPPRGFPPGPPLDPLIRMIAERRPELAERLERLRRRSPEQFRDVMLKALMFRLEDALNEAEEHPAEPSEHRRPRRPRRPDERPERPGDELQARERELDERHEGLEVRSHELAEQLRAARASEAEPAARQRLRAELKALVNEQFDVRTKLRRVELERIERELNKLRRILERLQGGLERRERERDLIIERRLDRLVGEDFAGW